MRLLLSKGLHNLKEREIYNMEIINEYLLVCGEEKERERERRGEIDVVSSES